MSSEDRQKRISELKALRAELLAYKESQEDSSQGEGNGDSIALLRKDYTEEKSVEESQSENVDSVRQEIYEQYKQGENLDAVDSEQKVLTRRR